MKKTSKLGCELVEPEDNTDDTDNMKNGEFVIQINGEIGWEITAESINNQLEKADGQDVVFEIASPGGSVFEGVEIFNAIRNYEGGTEARILGMAASMASYIPLATDKVLAEDNATFMIHNAWGIAIGDSEAMKAEAEILASINELIAREYVKKTGKKEKEILQMMSDETWMFGKEIKDEGFIDEIIVHKEEEDSKNKKKDKNKDKENALIEAKEKFKSTLTRINENRKSDLEKMRGRLNNLNKKSLGGNMKMKQMSKFVKMSYKDKKALPDSAFAVVYNEGDKKVRKLAFRDSDGKVDIPHLRNALVRIIQNKIKLTPTQRSTALAKLTAVAKKYLKANKGTKSAKIMSDSISKFESVASDKLNDIVSTLKKLATNKKPEDEVSLEVKQISLLIDDLEGVVALEKKAIAEEEVEAEEEPEDNNETEPEEEDESEKKKKKGKGDKEDKKEDKEKKNKGEEEDSEEEPEDSEESEDDEDDGEEESKFQEALKVAEGYKKELTKNQELTSKFQKKSKELEKQNNELSKQISKFKKDEYSKVLNATVDKVSKFKQLNSEESLNLKKTYLESKMSESALVEIGRVTDDKMLSKLGEPKPTTKPSSQLEPAKAETEYSKMSKEDKLDALADTNAKRAGFVPE